MLARRSYATYTPKALKNGEQKKLQCQKMYLFHGKGIILTKPQKLCWDLGDRPEAAMNMGNRTDGRERVWLQLPLALSTINLNSLLETGCSLILE